MALLLACITDMILCLLQEQVELWPQLGVMRQGCQRLRLQAAPLPCLAFVDQALRERYPRLRQPGAGWIVHTLAQNHGALQMH